MKQRNRLYAIWMLFVLASEKRLLPWMRRVNILHMKKSPTIALVAIALGMIAYESRSIPGYAAASTAATEGQATPSPTPDTGRDPAESDPAALVKAGSSVFQQNCSFCHGRDAAGGETGPDLTRSKMVARDVGGDKIGEIVRNGRPEKKMPPFNLTNQEMAAVVAFIHAQEALGHNGNRRGVEVADLQTGNVEAGRRYFNGAGKCVTCHSPSGDLSGIASRYQGLELEERMLYPENAKGKVTVTLPSDEKVTGALAYLDEFTVGLRDSSGTYRSWSIPSVKYSVDSPAEAHVALFDKYPDADIHNLMAYLQTLR